MQCACIADALTCAVATYSTTKPAYLLHASHVTGMSVASYNFLWVQPIIIMINSAQKFEMAFILITSQLSYLVFVVVVFAALMAVYVYVHGYVAMILYISYCHYHNDYYVCQALG